jgi:hypothetical protein
MPNKKIRGGSASTLIKYVSGADAPANVNPGGQTPQAMPNSITAGPAANYPRAATLRAANFSRGGRRSTRKGGRRSGGRRSLRKGGRRSTRKGGRRSTKKGGGVLATAALPFGLFGLQRLFGKKFTRKLRHWF